MRWGVPLVVLAACHGSEPPPAKQSPVKPASAPGDAAPAPDATIGPILDLVRCVPAAVMPGDSASKPADVKIGPIKIVEPAAGAQIGVPELLKQRRNRLRFCYEQNLFRKPALAGSSLMTVIVAPTGYVHEAYLEQSIDDELSLCIKHIVSELEFSLKGKPEQFSVKVPLEFSWGGTPSDGDGTPGPWTPFAASNALVSTDAAVQAAVALQKAMPTAELATCLTNQTGSLRAMLQVAADGSVRARVGGVGDSKAEACIAEKLVGVHVSAMPAASEVACDFVRGDVKPWRVAADAGYAVIDATADKVSPVTAEPKATAVVLVSPTTTGPTLARALKMASGYAAWLVGMKGSDGSVELVAAERKARLIADPSTPLVLDTREPMRVCGGLLDNMHSGPAAQIDTLLTGVARTCTQKPCPAQLTIGIGTHTGAELATYAAAARAAGFERVRFGAASCPATR